jgi:hypothetical protein
VKPSSSGGNPPEEQIFGVRGNAPALPIRDVSTGESFPQNVEESGTATLQDRDSLLPRDFASASPEEIRASTLVTQESAWSLEDLKAEVMQHPLVRNVQENFGGHIIDYGQLR